MKNLPSTNSSLQLKADTLLDRIYASYLDEAMEQALTPHELLQRERLEAAWGLLVQYHSFEQAIPLLKNKYSISRATAYRLLGNATKLFGDVTQSHKEGLRHILYEYSMKVFQLAASQKPPDLKQMNTAIKNMAMLKGLDQKDGNIIDPELLQAHTYMLQLSLAGKDKAKTVNLEKIPEAELADVVDVVEGMAMDQAVLEKLLDKAAGKKTRKEEE